MNRLHFYASIDSMAKMTRVTLFRWSCLCPDLTVDASNGALLEVLSQELSGDVVLPAHVAFRLSAGGREIKISAFSLLDETKKARQNFLI